MMTSNDYRAVRIIRKTIEFLNLDLNPYVVLTEVGSHNYIYTPIIPLLAGAKKVYAWTGDSPYGKGELIADSCLEIAKFLGVEERLEFSVNKKNNKHVRMADMITNSGFVRPIDKAFLENAKRNIVVPLMFEAWELRSQDIDIQACTEKSVWVAGTWESHPKIRVFDYIKELTLKLLFEAGFEISGNNFIVWSSDHFGQKAKEVLTCNDAESVVLTSNYDELLSNIKDIDAVLLFDYHETRDYFGPDGIFNLAELKNINSHFAVIHLFGNVNVKYLREKEIEAYPDKKGNASSMTFTLAYLGLLPVIRLLTAGFKVGQESLEKKLSNLSQPINF